VVLVSLFANSSKFRVFLKGARINDTFIKRDPELEREVFREALVESAQDREQKRKDVAIQRAVADCLNEPASPKD